MIPTGLDDNIIYQTGSFVKAFQDQMEQTFRENGIDITAEQFNVLTYLWYQDGLSQQQLSAMLNRDKTTVSRVLDRMIKRNLVERVRGTKDKRERLIHLTKRGMAVQNKLVTLSGGLYMKAIEGLSEKKILHMLKVLDHMKNNLE